MVSSRGLLCHHRILLTQVGVCRLPLLLCCSYVNLSKLTVHYSKYDLILMLYKFTLHCIVYIKLLSLTQVTTSWCIQTTCSSNHILLALVYAMVVTSSEGCFINIFGLYDFSEVCPILEYWHTCVNCRVNVFMLTGIQQLPFLRTYRIA